jgi:alpha-L-fucosidase
MTIDRISWGFRRNALFSDYFSLEELIKELVITVSTGGNLLMNVGPTKDGIISPIFEERLRGMGNRIDNYKIKFIQIIFLVLNFFKNCVYLSNFKKLCI